MSNKFQIFSGWYFRRKFVSNAKSFFSLPQRSWNFSCVFILALKLDWLADTQRRYSCPYDALSSYNVFWHCNEVVCPLGRRYFLKKVIPSCSKCEITYRFSKAFENIYEEIQFSEVTGLQPSTLLMLDSFIEIQVQISTNKLFYS